MGSQTYCFYIMLCSLYAISLHKKKFSIKDFFTKCDQIRSFLRTWSHLVKKSLMENLTFCAVFFVTFGEEPDDLFSFGYIKNVTELVILLEKPITLLLPF